MSGPGNEGRLEGAQHSRLVSRRAEAEAVSTSRPGPPPRSQRPAFTRNSLSRDMGR